MPGMLGAQGTRRYLLVFQNNAEVRSTGGLPGSVALIVARDGEVDMKRQASGASFGEAPEPALPLTPAEKEIYGPQLGTCFLDATFTPDFPRAAALMTAHWERRFGQLHRRGLRGRPGGAVLRPRLSPVRSTSGRTESLTSDERRRGAAQLRLRCSSRTPLNRTPSSRPWRARCSTPSPRARGRRRSSLRAVARGVDEHRILGHSFDEEEQAAAGRQRHRRRAGHRSRRPVRRWASTSTTTPGRRCRTTSAPSVSVDATFCKGGTQGMSGEATLESVAPPDAGTRLPAMITGGGVYGIPAGSQLVALRLYAPVRRVGQPTSSSTGSRSTTCEIVEQDGRQVATSYVFLDPGQQVTVTWSMVTGEGADRGHRGRRHSRDRGASARLRSSRRPAELDHAAGHSRSL